MTNLSSIDFLSKFKRLNNVDESGGGIFVSLKISDVNKFNKQTKL